MVAFGFYQLWPLISLTFFSGATQVEGEILVCDFIPEEDGYRLHIIYEYCVPFPSASNHMETRCVLASALSNASGNVIDSPVLSAEEMEFFQPIVDDTDKVAEYLPRPMVLYDANNPLRSGRLYLAFDQSNYRYGALCIALPMIIWLSSLLIRSFVIFHREPTLV